jgi:hypothetical protein
MNKEFIPYELALGLKQLGFQERCLGHYWENLFYFRTTFHHPSTMPNSPESCLAPTYAQAFRWFREKYKLKCCIIPLVCEQGYSDLYESRIHQEKHSISIIGNYKIYEEAELACLKKLIKIVKGGNK